MARLRILVLGALGALTLGMAPGAAGAAAVTFVQPPGSPFAATDPPFVPNSAAVLGGMAIGDFTGNGIDDVAVTAGTGVPAFSPGESVTVLLGERRGGLTPAPGGPVQIFGGGDVSVAGAIAAGDFTGSGHLDLAVTADGTVRILLGDGHGGFTLSPTSLPYQGSGQTSIAVGDFTGSGHLDIAVVTTELVVYLGDGNGHFTPAPGSPMAVPGYPSSIAAAPFTHDGRDDLAITEPTMNAVAVYLSAPDGSFSPAPGSPYSTGQQPEGVAAGEFSDDGNLDLATTNSLDDDVSVLLGDGRGDFGPAADSPIAVPIGGGVPAGSLGLPGPIAAGDLTGGGIADLAVANTNGPSSNVAILVGNGHGGFTNASGSPVPANGNPDAIAVGDVTGDDLPDIVAENPFLGRVTELDNESSAQPNTGATTTTTTSTTTTSTTTTSTSPAPPPPVVCRVAKRPRAVAGRLPASAFFKALAVTRSDSRERVSFTAVRRSAVRIASRSRSGRYRVILAVETTPCVRYVAPLPQEHGFVLIGASVTGGALTPIVKRF